MNTRKEYQHRYYTENKDYFIRKSKAAYEANKDCRRKYYRDRYRAFAEEKRKAFYQVFIED